MVDLRHLHAEIDALQESGRNETAAHNKQKFRKQDISVAPVPTPNGLDNGTVGQSAQLNDSSKETLSQESGTANGTVGQSEKPKRPRLKPYTLEEFLSLDIKPREMVLDPVIPEKGLVMIYASRGTGKTLLSHGIAYAVATGTKFLKWQAPKPRNVLVIDGEMPAPDLKTKWANTVVGTPNEAGAGAIKIISSDLIDGGGVGNLASPSVQKELEPWLDGIGLLMLDNLSSLTDVVRDNDAESWSPIQNWLLSLRRKGISVIIIHHAGKGGQQRGTSRREDVLDTSISLRRPDNYKQSDGARFEVHIEKGRGLHGDAANPFEAKMEIHDGATVWTVREIEDLNLIRVRELLDDGLSVRDISKETNIPKSTVHRLKRKIEAEGKADDK